MDQEKIYHIKLPLSKSHLRTLYKDDPKEQEYYIIIDNLSDKDMKKITKTIATVWMDGEYWEQLRECFEGEYKLIIGKYNSEKIDKSN